MGNVYKVTEDFSKVPVASPTSINDNTNIKTVHAGSGSGGTCVVEPTGGVKITSNNNANAHSSFQPTSASAFGGVTWLTDSQPTFEAQIKTPSSLSGVEIDVGIAQLPLNFTSPSYISTNFPSATFTYDAAISPNWILTVTSGNSILHEVITAFPVAASTSYKLKIAIDGSFNVLMYINDVQAYFNAVGKLLTGQTLSPEIGVAGNAKSLIAHSISMSQQA